MRSLKFFIILFSSLSGLFLSSVFDNFESIDLLESESISVSRSSLSNDLKQQVLNVLNQENQFEKAFYTTALREEFLNIICDRLTGSHIDILLNLSVGNIISTFDANDCPRSSFALECLLDYVDRQPAKSIPDYCNGANACKSLALSVIRSRSLNMLFWRKFSKMNGVGRFELFRIIRKLPGITEEDIDDFSGRIVKLDIIDLFIKLPFIFIILNSIHGNFFEIFSPEDSITPFLIFLISFITIIYHIGWLSFKYFVIDDILASISTLYIATRLYFQGNQPAVTESTLNENPSARLISLSFAELENDIADFLKDDIQFNKIFYSNELRQKFILNVAGNLRNSIESNSALLNKGLMIKNFNLNTFKKEGEILSCVLEYIDRLPKFELNNYSADMDPLIKFASTFILTRTENNEFWGKFCQIKRISRYSLFQQSKLVFGIDDQNLNWFLNQFRQAYVLNFAFSLFPGSLIYVLLKFLIGIKPNETALANLTIYFIVLMLTGHASFNMFIYEHYTKFISSSI